jgi:hypothetical protein
LGRSFPESSSSSLCWPTAICSEVEGEGPIVIYLRDGAPEHAGRWGGAAVISKWGAAGTHIWQHALWDVPASYGDDARFFAALPTAVALYRRWAADRGP